MKPANYQQSSYTKQAAEFKRRHGNIGTPESFTTPAEQGIQAAKADAQLRLRVEALLQKSPRTAGMLKSVLYAACGINAQQVDWTLTELAAGGKISKNEATGRWSIA